ncbi:Cold shock protein CspA [Candidatus Brocadiaceae bacterium]|nr:Cold shock protein CspA [Candidatus Brocadiaceae bacterium]
MQLYEGIIKSWLNDKGFGFIQPNEGGKDIFIHIRDLKHQNYQPKIGDKIVYKITSDKNGKTRGYDAFIKGQQINNVHKENSFKQEKPEQQKQFELSLIPRVILAVIPFILSGVLIKQHTIYTPLFAYLFFSPLTFIFYAYDKSMALKDKWRISEATLHLLELLGGWPAALITQYTIRHKNKKTSFQIIFWFIIILHLSGLISIIFYV